jgi:hypothetical protein
MRGRASGHADHAIHAAAAAGVFDRRRDLRRLRNDVAVVHAGGGIAATNRRVPAYGAARALSEPRRRRRRRPSSSSRPGLGNPPCTRHRSASRRSRGATTFRGPRAQSSRHRGECAAGARPPSRPRPLAEPTTGRAHQGARYRVAGPVRLEREAAGGAEVPARVRRVGVTVPAPPRMMRVECFGARGRVAGDDPPVGEPRQRRHDLVREPVGGAQEIRVTVRTPDRKHCDPEPFLGQGRCVRSRHRASARGIARPALRRPSGTSAETWVRTARRGTWLRSRGSPP